MIKRLGVVVALVALGASAEAAGLGVGVKTGLVFPNFKTEGLVYLDLDNLTSGQAGVYFVGRQKRVLGLQGEINYLRKKAEGRSSRRGGFSLSIDYLQVPLLMRLQSQSRPNQEPRLYAILGPSFDLKVRESVATGSRRNGASVERFDWAVIAGGGIKVRRILLEARYSRGLRRVDRIFTHAEIKSHSFAFLAGLRLK